MATVQRSRPPTLPGLGADAEVRAMMWRWGLESVAGLPLPQLSDWRPLAEAAPATPRRPMTTGAVKTGP
jgi:hypothetical protein